MIDPKRLTEADKGREVFCIDEDGDVEYGFISTWDERRIYVRYVIGTVATDPDSLDFVHGTYQDGGTE